MSVADYEALRRRLDVAVRPLEARHRGAKRRTRSRFRARMPGTASLLAGELKHLKASRLVLQLELEEAEQRLDGWPRAGANVKPTVVLSFDSKHGPMEWVADQYDCWQDNLRAIALTMEYLRGVERFGVVKSGQQYAGWRALPQTTGGTTPLEVLRRVAGHPGPDGDDPASVRSLYRLALKRAHPDQGGSRDDFDRVQQAGRALGVA